jgi:hypothetical protein
MSKTVALAVTCTCKDKKEFIYSVQVENSPGGSTSVSMQIDCPFSRNKNCAQHLTIQLPPGMKPKSDENILRG